MTDITNPMIITRTKLREWRACYSDDRIAELVPEDGLSPLEVLALDIPPADRLWVVLREDVIPARELRHLACDWAERALDRLPPDQVDPRSREAIAVSRRYADGLASAEELREARVAAREAANASWLRSATPTAAVGTAAADAAADRADRADRVAAAEAAVAALETERDQQIADVRAVLVRLGGVA